MDWRLVSAIDPDTVYRKGDIAALQAGYFEILRSVCSYLTLFASGHHRKSHIFGCRERRSSLTGRCKSYKVVPVVAIMYGIPPALPGGVGKVQIVSVENIICVFVRF